MKEKVKRLERRANDRIQEVEEEGNLGRGCIVWVVVGERRLHSPSKGGDLLVARHLA